MSNLLAAIKLKQIWEIISSFKYNSDDSKAVQYVEYIADMRPLAYIFYRKILIVLHGFQKVTVNV